MIAGLDYTNEPVVVPTRREPVEAGLAGGAVEARSTSRPAASPAASPEQLAWYRWVTGHQICIVCWRLTGMSLVAARGPGAVVGTERLLADAALLLRTSALAVRYTGSCPASVYGEVIRPRMERCHPSFTGRWSRDYVELAQEMHDTARLAADPGGPAHRELRAAFGVYLRTHREVAQRLVPEGPSLLRQSPGAAPSGPEGGYTLFDSFFLVHRGRASESDLHAALVRRLENLRADLAINGWTYEGDGLPAAPAPSPPPDLAAMSELLALVLESQHRVSTGLAVE